MTKNAKKRTKFAKFFYPKPGRFYNTCIDKDVQRKRRRQLIF